RAMIARLADADGLPDELNATLAFICARSSLLPPAVAAAGVSDEALWRFLRAGLTDARESQGFAYTVRRTYESAAGMRDRLGADHWRFLQRLNQAVERLQGQVMDVARALDLLDTSILNLAAVAGLH